MGDHEAIANVDGVHGAAGEVGSAEEKRLDLGAIGEDRAERFILRQTRRQAVDDLFEWVDDRDENVESIIR
jgi:hypothetical protein